MRKKALGRGLEALIPRIDREKEPPPSEIDIDLIKPNPDQPRLHLDDKTLDELTVSIRDHGVLQPILVRPFGIGYQLIAGERRLLAAQRAGLLKIPAVIRDVPDEQLLILALVENIQREQLNPIEEAQAYQNLLDNLRSTQEELAAHLGKERSTVANALRLLKLPSAVKLLVSEGKLTPGHARAILSSGAGAAEMARAARKMADQAWSVREAERWAKRFQAVPVPKTPKPQDPNEAAAVDRLRLRLGTKVEILSGHGAEGAGQIRIHFYSPDDLVRIYSILCK